MRDILIQVAIDNGAKPALAVAVVDAILKRLGGDPSQAMCEAGRDRMQTGNPSSVFSVMIGEAKK